MSERDEDGMTEPERDVMREEATEAQQMRTVPVPVSLIEHLARELAIHGAHDAAAGLLPLLSQPTPTNEPTCTCGHAMDEHDLSETGECQVAVPWCPCMRATDAAEPPRIEDLAPGTTFTAAATEDVWRWAVRADGLVVSGLGVGPMAALDPSTIRDVAPPKEHR